MNDERPTTETGRWLAEAWPPRTATSRLVADIEREASAARSASPDPDLDVERLARAIHAGNDHPNVPGCLDMDRDTAGVLATAYGAGNQVAAMTDHGPYDDGRHVIQHRHGGPIHEHALAARSASPDPDQHAPMFNTEEPR